MGNADHIKRIKELSSGLLYPSETDSPIEVEHLAGKPAPGIEDLTRTSTKGKKQSGEELPVAKFWEPLIKEQEWDEEEEREAREQARRLMAYVQESARNLHFYRIGDEEKELWLIGELEGGEAFALKSLVVET